MPLWARLRVQAPVLFLGVACLYAALSPFAIAGMGYTAEEMTACRQLLSHERPRIPPDFGVDWPRNGSTETLAACPFLLLGRALGGTPDWEDRALAMQPVLATAAIVTVVFAWASRLSGSRRKAFWLSMAAGFGTMLWPYAYIGLETTQSAFLLLAGYLALGETREPSWKRTIAFGLCAAVAVSAKSGGVALIPAVLFLAWALLRPHWGRLAAVLVWIGAAFVVNNHFRTLSWARFGGVRIWAQLYGAHDLLSALFSILALIFSPTKGLLLFAPLAVVGLAALHRAFRLDPKLAIFVFLSLAGSLAVVSQIRPWTDETWGPRYLHSAVAPLVLCLAPLLRSRPFSGLFRAAVLAAAAAGLAVSALGSLFYYGSLGSVAMRSTPLSLQALQGDPTWNHVAFNARLAGTWLRLRRSAASPPEFLPPPDPWDYSIPPRRPDWTPVDLREYAVPQPLLLRSLPAGGRWRLIRGFCGFLLVTGVFLLVFAGRAAALTDEAEAAARAAAEARAGARAAAEAEAAARRATEAKAAALAASTPAEIYDGLVSKLGFDPQHPGWSPALRDLHRRSRDVRLQLVPEFFYTPVFSPKDLPAGVWEATFPDCGRFDLGAQRAFLLETQTCREELGSLPADPPPEDDAVFYWHNEQFSHADAALYYTLIRRFRPKRIVEVGSGHSTKLARRAIRDNGSGSILCIEPNPPAWLQPIEGELAIHASPAQDAPDSVFLDLEPSDILFVDGSHISKTGSDVNHLFLRILPRLPPGVIVQVHDICLPFEYQRYWSEEVLCYWNEQYVLAALLANSSKFEILVGVYFVQKKDPELLRSLIPDVPGVMPGGGSLWLRSRA